MSLVREDVPVYPSQQFLASATAREEKFEKVQVALKQCMGDIEAQKEGSPNETKLGGAVRFVAMTRHREFLRRIKAIEFQNRTLLLCGQKFEFKNPRSDKSFFIEHIIMTDHADKWYYNNEHFFHVFDGDNENVTEKVHRTSSLSRGVLVATVSTCGSLAVEWDGITIKLDMRAIRDEESTCVSVSVE